jgi:hypothetical protein
MMKHMFDPSVVEEVRVRLRNLRPESERRWGRMSAAQAVGHMAAAAEMATGDLHLPRVLLGRILGRLVKAKVLADETPFGRNSPTAKELKLQAEPDFGVERDRLLALIDRFAAGGPAACSSHPHPFFGTLTPQEWAVLMYKHLDHHLRQFGG